MTTKLPLEYSFVPKKYKLTKDHQLIYKFGTPYNQSHTDGTISL